MTKANKRYLAFEKQILYNSISVFLSSQEYDNILEEMDDLWLLMADKEKENANIRAKSEHFDNSKIEENATKILKSMMKEKAQ